MAIVAICTNKYVKGEEEEEEEEKNTTILAIRISWGITSNYVQLFTEHYIYIMKY